MAKYSVLMVLAMFIVTITAWNIEWFQGEHCAEDGLDTWRITYDNPDIACGSCKVPGQPDWHYSNCGWFPFAKEDPEVCTVAHNPQPLSFYLWEGTKCQIGIESKNCDTDARVFGKSHTMRCLKVRKELKHADSLDNGAQIYARCGFEDEDVPDDVVGCFELVAGMNMDD